MAGALGSAPGIIVGVGVGAAASAALEPAIEVPRQSAWAANPNRVLDAGLMARLVAQGGVVLEVGRASALREGYSADKFDHLVYLAQTVPGIGEATALWRRGLMSDALFQHVLTKEGLDTRYVAGIVGNKIAEPLSPADLAFAVVRGLVPDDGILPVGPPTSGTSVPRFPVFSIDPVAEAEQSGMNRERFSVLVGRSGLSLAPGLAAQAYFREAINLQDFYLAVAEGDIRNEWRDALLAASRQILTSGEYAELELRGFLTADERRAFTARHGMSAEDSDRLYDVLGRSVNVHQVLIGERRGGSFQGPSDQIPPAYLQSLQRGNLRPEYYNLAYAARETYPSYFVTRALLQGKVITPDRGRQLFFGLGWPADVAEAAASFYGGGATATADPHVAKAQTQLWTATHRAYIGGEIDDAEAGSALSAAGVAAAAIPEVLNLWGVERQLQSKTLTPAQIKKAWQEPVTNPATGAPWTRDEALAALVALGYSANDANTFLEL